jgi:protein-disulfide isomerase
MLSGSRPTAARQLPKHARTDPLKPSSNLDLKRVQQKLSDPLNRRNVLFAGAGILALAAASAWFMSSSTEPSAATKPARKSGRVTEVPVEKLMEAGPLPDLAVGDAKAPVTIVEYASMTCGHCASFHNTVYPTLKTKYIDTGKARLIMREFPLDDRATGAAMLAR